jgi:hypothetical protein
MNLVKMNARITKVIWLALVFFILLDIARLPCALAQQSKRPFTIADDIGYRHFVPDGYANFDGVEGIVFSPNGKFLAVLTSRGKLDLNQVEDSLRFYRTRDIQDFLEHSDKLQPPPPVWVVNRVAKEEPIADFRWLADSSGVALLEHIEESLDSRIVLANLAKKSTEILPGAVFKFGGFDIASRENYVYVGVEDAARKELQQKLEAERRAPMTVLSGTDVAEAIVPDAPGLVFRNLSDKRHLWVVAGGHRSELSRGGTPFAISDLDSSMLVMSPDGHSLVTKLSVQNIPPSWETLYPPPYPGDIDSGIHAGGSAFEYVRIDLKTGELQALTDAPEADAAGWAAAGYGKPSWSSDGQAILLTGTFLKSKDNAPSRPCVAVVDLPSNNVSCVEELKGRKGPGKDLEQGYHWIMSARFTGGDKNLAEIRFMTFENRDESNGTIKYQRTSSGVWQVTGQSEDLREPGPKDLEISIKQGLGQPPLLVASNKETSRVIWNPNPPFENVDLGRVRVYSWKDKEGRDWTGGLYMPAGYQAGNGYPLVIQTHGFSESWFTPSGSHPTVFAARALTAAGIAVLQIGGARHCGGAGVEEAACEVSGFEGGVKGLVADGLVDAQKLGYIGFSRSCWYGMEMLTNGSIPLKAALLADGITVDYFEFALFGMGAFNDLIGAAPIGEGLQVWLKRSPGFHLEKVTAPLLIEVENNKGLGAISMWQPYSVLRYLHKPVQMVMLNTDEHVITNPAERMVSQGLSVDWFRFWLQGYEDPDPAKAEQYKRWRGLRKLQEEKDKKR